MAFKVYRGFTFFLLDFTGFSSFFSFFLGGGVSVMRITKFVPDKSCLLFPSAAADVLTLSALVVSRTSYYLT